MQPGGLTLMAAVGLVAGYGGKDETAAELVP